MHPIAYALVVAFAFMGALWSSAMFVLTALFSEAKSPWLLIQLGLWLFALVAFAAFSLLAVYIL